MKLLIFLLLATVILSAIVGIFFVINGLLNKKTIQQCFDLFVGSLIGGILGAIAGSLIGLILGYLLLLISYSEPDFISYDIYAYFSLYITFLICWFISTFIGSILGGKSFWEYYKN